MSHSAFQWIAVAMRRRRVFMIGVRPILLCIAVCVSLLAQSGGRITREKFMKAVQIGGLETNEFAQLIRSHGVDFQLSEEEQKTLAARGVAAQVLEAVAASLRPGEPAAPTAGATTAGAAAAEAGEVVAGRATAPSADRGAVVEEEIVAGGTAQMRATVSSGSRTASSKAVAVIVHKNNPLTSIDSSTLRRIYTGEQTAWKNGRNIYVINRDATGAPRKAFYKRILKSDASRTFYLQGMSMMFRPQQQEPGSTVRGYVSRIPDAIGYVDLAEVDGTVKVLAVNGIFPTEEALAKGTYPLMIDE